MLFQSQKPWSVPQAMVATPPTRPTSQPRQAETWGDGQMTGSQVWPWTHAHQPLQHTRLDTTATPKVCIDSVFDALVHHFPVVDNEVMTLVIDLIVVFSSLCNTRVEHPHNKLTSGDKVSCDISMMSQSLSSCYEHTNSHHPMLVSWMCSFRCRNC